MILQNFCGFSITSTSIHLSLLGTVGANIEFGRTYSLYEAPVEDWATILTLSNRWSFPGVKALAIRELQKKAMSDVKRIKLYKENHVDRNYLIPCYARLCERGEPLTAEEGLDLGMIDVIQIAAAREQARSSFLPSGARSPLTPTIHGADLDEVIRQVFQIAPHEPGFNPDETTHITGALVLLSQLKSFLCPSNQSSFFFIQFRRAKPHDNRLTNHNQHIHRNRGPKNKPNTRERRNHRPRRPLKSRR